MIAEFLKTLNDHTRATYYVLPLISLNKFSFGPPENFINAYANQEGTQLKVVVKDSSLSHPIVWNETPLVSFSDTELIFDIPSQFRRDLERFWKGEYSQFRDEAKNLIRQYSGLAFEQEKTASDGSKRIYTDARILILERDPEVREYLENELRVAIDPKSELLSPPKEDEIWKQVEEPVTV